MQDRLPVTRYVSKYFPPIVDARNLDHAAFGRRLETAQRRMRQENAWLEDGQNYDFREATTRNIALGRYQFYVQFADFLYERNGKRSYLLDYMTRSEDGLEDLLFYIRSASRIDINLEGVSVDHLRQATVGLGRAARNLDEIAAPHTTAWEINQVFHGGLRGKSWFHTGSAMTRWQAMRAMGFRVPPWRVLDDNRHLLEEFQEENENLGELEAEP